MTRLGIVGPGLIWQKQHRSCVEKLNNDFTVTAFCGSSEKTKSTIEKDYPGTAFFTDYRDMARSDSIDAVVVLTPIPLNAPVTLAALNAGKHVFVEKPMATSIADSQAIIEAEKSSGKKVFVLEQFAYAPVWGKLREIIESGTLGTVSNYNYVQHARFDENDNDAGGYGKTAWRSEADFPLGLLFDGGIHAISALTKVFGVPKKTMSVGQSFRENFGEYDQVSMCFVHESGVVGNFSQSALLPESHNGFQVFGTEGTCTIDGGKIFVTRNGDKEEFAVDKVNASLEMWKCLAQCMVDGSDSPYGSREALGDIAVLETVAKSAKSGQVECISY